MTATAQAAVARVPAGPWEIEQITIADPRDNEVLVRIAGTGLCHTDVAFAAGMHFMKPPAVFGHEGAGVVVSTGAAVTKVRPGDHVVLSFASCGECSRCRKNHPAYCIHFAALNYGGCRADGTSGISIGDERVSGHFFGQSSFANLALATERNVVPIERDVPLDIVGPLGCGVQTGAGSIMQAMACAAGSSLLITGGGTVGLSAVLGAVVQGCATIIVAEPMAARRELALALGATHALDPAVGSLAEAVTAICPEGVDYAFDTTSRDAALAEAFKALGSNSTLGLVGIAHDPEAALPLPINHLIGAGIRVMGIIEGDVVPDQFIPHMIALWREGRFPFDRLIRRYPLAEVNQAIADQHAGRCVKPVMIP